MDDSLRSAAPDLRRVDHLVYATPDLARSVDELEARLGVRATPGGRHPGRGSHNALLALGPTSYLEIIGPDPEQPEPERPRSFGIDRLAEPRLVTWAANAGDLERRMAEARAAGIALGDVVAGGRKRPDGVVLAWRLTRPTTLVADGIVPFLIDWGTSPHPARDSATGITLVDLRAEHPDAAHVQRMLGALGIGLPVAPAARPALIATLTGPRGRTELR